MEILASVIAAVVLIGASALFGGYLPGASLCGGSFYRIIAVVLAIIVSAVINLPMLYMFRGNSLYAKRQYEKALASYKKAYKTGRLSPEMAIYYGYIALKEGDAETAEAVFEKLGKKENLKPSQETMFDTNYALLLWKKGDLDGAISLLKSVEPSPTRDGSLGALLLEAAGRDGNYTEAFAFCSEAHERYQYDKTVMCNMGEALFRTGENEKAAEIFAELIEMRPTTPAPYYMYGRVLDASGREDDAEDMYRKALRFRFTALSTVSRREVKSRLQKSI